MYNASNRPEQTHWNKAKRGIYIKSHRYSRYTEIANDRTNNFISDRANPWWTWKTRDIKPWNWVAFPLIAFSSPPAYMHTEHASSTLDVLPAWQGVVHQYSFRSPDCDKLVIPVLEAINQASRDISASSQRVALCCRHSFPAGACKSKPHFVSAIIIIVQITTVLPTPTSD